MEFLAKVLEVLGSAEGMVATIAIVLEFLLRVIPTKKPLGILHIVAKVAHGLGEIFSRIGKFLDKVLPQNISEE
jgi:hypothetical protein